MKSAENREGDDVTNERASAEAAAEASLPAEPDRDAVFATHIADAVRFGRDEISRLRAARLRHDLHPEPEGTEAAVPTLRALVANDRSLTRTLFERTKRTAAKIHLGLRGSQHPEELYVLLQHLGTQFNDREWRDIDVPAARTDNEISQLESNGFKVTGTSKSWAKDGWVTIKAQRDSPFHAESTDIPRLDKLTHLRTDILELVHSLQQMDFYITGQSFHLTADLFEELGNDPAKSGIIQKLAACGITAQGENYFAKPDAYDTKRGVHPITIIENLAGDPTLISHLTATVIEKIRSLAEDTQLVIPLDKRAILDIISVSEDTDAEKVLRSLAEERDDGLKYMSGAVQFVLAAKDLGILPHISRLCESVSLIQLESVRNLLWGRSEQTLNDALTACEAELASVAVEGDEVQFLDDVAALIGKRLPVSNALRIKAVAHRHDDTLAVLGLLRDCGVELEPYTLESVAGIVEQAAANKEYAAHLFDPDFRKFAKALAAATGQQLSSSDFLPSRYPAPVLEAYGDKNTREALLQPRVAAVVRALGKFSSAHADEYVELAKIPELPEFIEQLRKNFGFEPRRESSLSVSFYQEVAGSPGAREDFLSPQAVALFKRLQTDFGIIFDFTYHKSSRLLLQSAAINNSVEAQIYRPENVSFAKPFKPHTLERLWQYTNAPQEIRLIAQRLNAAFGYCLQLSDPDKLGDRDALLSLSADAERSAMLFSAETVRRVTSLIECGYNPSYITLAEIEGLAAVPEECARFIEALHKSFSYSFRLRELPLIEPHAPVREQAMPVLQSLARGGHTFQAAELPLLSKLFICATEKIDEKLALMREGKNDFRFSADLADSLFILIEKDYKTDDMRELKALYKHYAGDDKWIPYDIPSLIFLREHKSSIVATHEAIKRDYRKGDLAWFSPITHGERLQKIHNYGLLADMAPHKERPFVLDFIVNNADWIGAVPKEKRGDYIDISLSINESPSQEIKRLQRELLAELVQTDDPVGFYRKIESIFIKNNLPTVGKVFKVFETLYPRARLEKSLQGGQGSPVLSAATARRRYYTIYRDLLMTHIRSGNRSLRRYAEFIRDGAGLAETALKRGPSALDAAAQEKLTHLILKLQTLREAASFNPSLPASSAADLSSALLSLETELAVRKGGTLVSRAEEMFLTPIGLSSVDEMLTLMRQTKAQADKRGRAFAAEIAAHGLVFKAGDLLKGVNEAFIANILQNGSVAKEFLGAASSQDSTPLDTDVSKVLPHDVEGGLQTVLTQSMAPEYGHLIFAIRDRGQFSVTRTDGVTTLPTKDSRLELFETTTPRHCGIRTGFPTTEIDCILADSTWATTDEGAKSLERLFFEIAQNGFYIPVTDTEGTLLFSPELYDARRRIFEGLERFDGGAFIVNRVGESDPDHKAIAGIIREKRGEETERSTTLRSIESAVATALLSSGVRLKSRFDSSLMGAELVEIGSVGRQTNTPKDFDFDFALKLDAKDFPKAAEIAAGLRKQFVMTGEESHGEPSGYYQFRAKGVSMIGDVALSKPVDIDIGLGSRSELAVFDSHEALREKYEWIRENLGEEALMEVVANVVLAKRFLKHAAAYKKAQMGAGEGGMGGIGIEHWVMQNHGNMREAFTSFIKAAVRDGSLVPLDEFKAGYRIIDPGMNIKKGRHDNFVLGLTESGYANMASAIAEHLGIELRTEEGADSHDTTGV